MFATPYGYDYINTMTSKTSPSTVHVKNTALGRYFQKYLLQKAMSVYKWTLPEGWSKSYFLYTLYMYGYVGIIETDKFGVIPQQCTLGGYNIYYQPKELLISNPLIKNTVRATIDTNCTLIKLQPDYSSIADIICYYADMLALASESIGVNFVNSKVAYMFGASNKAEAESYKAAMDQINAGNPAVVVDKHLLGADGKPTWQYFVNNVKQSYIANEVLSDMRRIEAMFDTDIGIPNINIDKRERMVTDEVNANNIETYAKASLWLEELKNGCAKTREMFGIEIDVDWRYKDGQIGNAISVGNI